MPPAKHFMPDGQHVITPHLIVKNSLEAIKFYEQAFGAELIARAPGTTPNSTMHAEIRIGGAAVFLMDAQGPQLPESKLRAPPNQVIHMWVPDADATFARALAAGATVTMPLADQFWGGRYGHVLDPFGHVWAIATQKEELTLEEIQRRAKELFAEGGGS